MSGNLVRTEIPDTGTRRDRSAKGLTGMRTDLIGRYPATHLNTVKVKAVSATIAIEAEMSQMSLCPSDCRSIVSSRTVSIEEAQGKEVAGKVLAGN